ncbi:MAG: galactose mutarotase [Nitrososphaera sp.]|nr:galactose mutarotase [Nitrososphaera sp.]MCI0708176.1 galactose mutarotase [Ignavibacteriota bacterium]
MSITKQPFGTTPDGKEVSLFSLTNGNVTAKITNYGGTITELWVPDKNGVAHDIVLGYDSLNGYFSENNPYFGCVVGRYANRIARGKFKIDGTEYTLATNDGANHLHGGVKGFDKVVWEATPSEDSSGVGLKLQYTSPDGEEGYPGTLTVTVTYTLKTDNTLSVSYEATADKATIVNLSHHSYFNLSGGKSADILGHQLTLNTPRYTVVDATLIPTGELKPVEGTPFDFQTPQAIGSRIEQVTGGYDHNYVLARSGSGLELAARVEEPTSGRTMEIWSTEPGIQFYSGNFLDGSITGKGGTQYVRHAGFCLEPQHYPDSPNQPTFPSTVLKPGETYSQEIVLKFGVIK